MAKLSTSLDMAAIRREGQAYLATLEAQGIDLPSLERITPVLLSTGFNVQNGSNEFAEPSHPPITRKL